MDRVDAGRRLAERLRPLAGQDVVVLGLPRGGVPVASEVARAIGAPLDVIVVRKLGVPFQPELAFGAVGEDGVRVVNDEVVAVAGLTEAEMAEVERRERVELERRAARFRGNRSRVDLQGRTAVIVDDGVATGSTALAACRVARAHGAARVVLAVPVAPPDVGEKFARDADEVIALETPEPFWAVGQFYVDFSPTRDDEVSALLDRAARLSPPSAAVTGAAGTDPPLRDDDIALHSVGAELAGHLMIPEQPVGIVLFAHGSGSGRHSPRNRFVASTLNDAGLGTLLMDLLTTEEEADRANVFDVDLLATRLAAATRQLADEPGAAGLPVGYFGASTGAAAALWTAADLGSSIGAVVSRGGRPDLAGPRLADVVSPTLLIVGGADPVVLDVNQQARARLGGPSRLEVIPGATHLFEEPGALEDVAELARDWFLQHLADDDEDAMPTGDRDRNGRPV